MKILYQGSPGAYSHLAALQVYPDAEIISCKTFDQCFEQAKKNDELRIIIPESNRTTGSIGIEYLIFKYRLNIYAEHFLKIEHNLLGMKGAKVKDLKNVFSHAQALSQCSKFINNNELIANIHADTAGSAKEVAKLNNKEDAAIASKLAAEIYDLKIIQDNIQDTIRNITRFVIMSKEMAVINPEEDKTMCTMVYEVKSIPAALYKSLGGFATNGVNITKLESYIHPQGFDVAQFYIDFEGHPDNPSVKLALDDLKFYSKKYNLLGIYKAANFRKK